VVLPSSEVTLYRRAMADVNTLAEAALRRLWAQLNPSDAEQARDGLLDLLPGIVTAYHVTAATVTADWYDLMRADRGPRGRFTAVVPDPPNPERARVLARWGVGSLFSADPNPVVALSKLTGGLQRVITDGARETVTVSSTQDPAKPGWTRVGTGRCDWCRERIGLHITSDTIFESHDACGCVAVPAFN
jgi:hypothetical protein